MRRFTSTVLAASLMAALVGFESMPFGGEDGNHSAAPAAYQVDTGHVKHIVAMPDQIEWTTEPALPPGVQVAVLEGDPKSSGMFTIRARMPDRYRVPPHWHPNPERITVLSGTLFIGAGEQFDPSNAHKLPAGAYISMPAKMKHFAWTEGETEIQISTTGPWGITYINPADDPRQANRTARAGQQ